MFKLYHPVKKKIFSNYIQEMHEKIKIQFQSRDFSHMLIYTQDFIKIRKEFSNFKSVKIIVINYTYI